MTVDRTTLQTHRARLLGAGAKLFRSKGVSGVSLAKIGAAAGLTHGAFYGHYGSKADLVVAACETASLEAVVRWRERANSARLLGQDPLAAIIDGYLSLAHCDDPGQGCALASLAGDAGRPGNAPMA